MTANVACLL